MNITFAIPTWNRAKLLERCVESIAQQNPHRIVISDNASTDDTKELCEYLIKKYPFISYKRREVHGTCYDNFKSVVGMAEGDYIWMFGDDDVLEPSGLNFANKLLDLNMDFYHVSEVSRSKSHTIFTGELIDLCCQYGFIEMTGFISGNIVRSEKLKRAFNSHNWEIYEKSAFAHALGILEVCAQSECALVDIPLIRSPQSDTQESVERWKSENIAQRYVFVSDGLEKIIQMGIIPEKLPEIFFRYLDGTLIKRLMGDYIARTVNPIKPVSDEEWLALGKIVQMIDGERGKDLSDWFYRVKSKADESSSIIQQALEKANKLSNEASTIKFPVYEYGYVT